VLVDPQVVDLDLADRPFLRVELVRSHPEAPAGQWDHAVKPRSCHRPTSSSTYSSGEQCGSTRHVSLIDSARGGNAFVTARQVVAATAMDPPGARNAHALKGGI
jgi:hypothetical protein